MIDWTSAIGLLAAVVRDPSISDSVRRHVTRVPRFQNVEYPIVLNPLVLSSLERLRPLVESYVRLLDKVVALYRRDPEVRAFYGLPRTAERLIDAEGSRGGGLHICRLDGYLSGSAQELRILENNADCPAGTLFTPRVNCLSRAILGRYFCDFQLLDPFAERPDVFLDALLAAYRDSGLDADPPVVAILQIRDRSNIESVELAHALDRRGSPAVVVDPRELDFDGRGLSHAGRHVDLIWNKINTVYWRSVVEPLQEVVDRFLRALVAGGTCFVNTFGARYVAEAKTTLALFHDDRLSDRFTANERELARRLVPPTHKLEPQRTVTTESGDRKLHDLVADRPYEWVLKQPYDIRGDGVSIGRDTPASVWGRLLHDGAAAGLVAQEYVEPCRFPVLLSDVNRVVRTQNSSLDCFVFRGRLAGFGAKTSAKDKVNLFQGGAKLPVFVSGTAA